MPRTKCSKEYNPSIMEQYGNIKNDIDKEIFFNYYLGYRTNGAQGYDVSYVPGSTAHWKGVGEVYTKQKFRSIGQSMALLAQRFLGTAQNGQGIELVPPMEERPTFTAEQLDAMKEADKDTRTPMEKYADELQNKNWDEYFIFFMYYDGFRTNGQIGFSPRSGGPGGFNHKRATDRLNFMNGYTFRKRGFALGTLAKEFVDKNMVPPEEDRPVFEDEPPQHMVARAASILEDGVG